MSSMLTANNGLALNRSKKPWWLEHILALCTVLGTLITSIAYFAARGPEKALEVRILQADRLVSPDLGSVKQIELLFDKERVALPTHIVGEIVCVGRGSIRREDVEVPMTIVLGEGRVLAAGVVSTEPAGIESSVSALGDSVVIRHGLLNTGDRIRFDTLFDGRVSQPKIAARIVGVRSVAIVMMDESPSRRDVTWPNMPRWLQWAMATYAASLCAAGIGGLFLMTKRQFRSKSEKIDNEAFRVMNPTQIMGDMALVATDSGIAPTLAVLAPLADLRWFESAEHLKIGLLANPKAGWEPTTIDDLATKLYKYITDTAPAAVEYRIRQCAHIAKDVKVAQWIEQARSGAYSKKSGNAMLIEAYGVVHGALERAKFGRPKASEAAGLVVACLSMILFLLPLLFLVLGAIHGLWKG
jgi:hypothetical protein